MPLRDGSKLSELLRNKSGDELFDEIRKEMENSKRKFESNKNNWFGSGSPRAPRSRAFKREGFPFDSDSFFDKADPGVRSHLEDLAKKHPEFAGNLRNPLWGDSAERDWKEAFNVPVAVERERADGQSSSKKQPAHDEPSGESKADDSLNQHGLRNTVDLGVQIQKANQKAEDEPKRSCSAPPASSSPSDQSAMNREEPKRFTSKLEFTPVNPFGDMSAQTDGGATAATGMEGKPSSYRQIPIRTTNSPTGSPRMTREIPVVSSGDHSQTRSPYNSPTTGRKQPIVRTIPIIVEGRTEPVVPKNVDEPTAESGRPFQSEQTPLKRKFDSNGGNQTAPAAASPPPPQQGAPNGQSHQKPHPPQNKEIPVQQPAPPPPPPKPKDPMERIQEVQQEVESLAIRVDQYSGQSRTDKEYLYLDEMLTRELIKLDTIEVEGNEGLRTARKDVIKHIQKTIALLESKADGGKSTTQADEVPGASMEVDSTKVTNSVVSGTESTSG